MNENRRLLRRPDVIERTGLSRSTLYTLIANGRFPAPVRIATRAVAWHEADVDAWIKGRRPTHEK